VADDSPYSPPGITSWPTGMSAPSDAAWVRKPAFCPRRNRHYALRRHPTWCHPTNAEISMLHYAVIFFVIALIAAVFGFAGIAAGAAGIAKILFFVFLILAVVSFIANTARR
jgi:uncharacterized membrane protein YtjA (UPF0391 family)